jgi:hypothetical protein
LVPDEKKDDKYWNRRFRNTEATRKSRETKRIKTNKVLLRVAYLEQEQARLQEKLIQKLLENDLIKQQIEISKAFYGKNNWLPQG